MTVFTYLTPITYWLLVVIWTAILVFCLKRLRHRTLDSAFFATVLFILTIDAVRTLFESLYFGGWYTARVGLLPQWVFDLLVRPELVIIPKVVNLVAAVWVAYLLVKRWIPQEEEERLSREGYIRELESRAASQLEVEEALRESELRFRSIVESSPMGMHLYELQGNGDLILTGANPAADAILDINHDDLIGKPIEEAFPGLEYTNVPNQYKDICTFGRPWHNEDIHYKDGVISGAFQVYAFQTAPNRMAAQFMDITESKRNEVALSKTQFAVDNAAVAIFWVTPEGAISYLNNAACALTGYTREEALELSMLDLTPAVTTRQAILDRIRNGGPITYEVEGLRKDGTAIPMEITSHAIRFGDQEFEFAFVVDLTERKKTERALADLNQNLERKVQERTRELEAKASELEEANIRLSEVDRLKSALLSSVSHELKTPLTSIIGYAKLGVRDFTRHFSPLAAEDRKMLRRADRLEENLSVIQVEGARLLGLIDNFLALSQIESNLGKWSMQSVHMPEIIRRATELSRPHFAVHPDLSLEVDTPDQLPSVRGHADSLVQMLVNLLENAAKFSQRGTVRLAAAQVEGDMLRITVEDNGPGIPEEEQTRVFETFQQICNDDACFDKPSGIGMGLPIAKEIVEGAGGTISLHCPPSGGCVFTVDLPIENPEQEAI